METGSLPSSLCQLPISSLQALIQSILAKLPLGFCIVTQATNCCTIPHIKGVITSKLVLSFCRAASKSPVSLHDHANGLFEARIDSGDFLETFHGVRFLSKILPPHLCLSFLINNLPEPHQLEQGLVISFPYSVVLQPCSPASRPMTKLLEACLQWVPGKGQSFICHLSLCGLPYLSQNYPGRWQ